MRTCFRLALPLFLILPLPSTVRGAENPPPEPKILAQAVGETEPLTITWVDTTDGKVGLDSDLAETVRDLLSDAQYVFTDQGVILAKPKDGKLTPILPVLNQIHTQDNRVFILHVRSQGEENQLIIDGSTYFSTQDPTRGVVTLTMHILTKSGELASTYVEQRLTVQGNSTPAPAPAPDPVPIPRG